MDSGNFAQCDCIKQSGNVTGIQSAYLPSSNCSGSVLGCPIFWKFFQIKLLIKPVHLPYVLSTPANFFANPLAFDPPPPAFFEGTLRIYKNAVFGPENRRFLQSFYTQMLFNHELCRFTGCLKQLCHFRMCSVNILLCIVYLVLNRHSKSLVWLTFDTNVY